MTNLRKAMRRHASAIVMLVFAIILRMIAYAHVAGGSLESPNLTLYLSALRNHLAEYVWFNTLKPPLTYLVEAVVAKNVSSGVIFQYNVFLVMVYALDGAAAILLYLAVIKVGVSRHVAAVLIGLYYVAYLPFEEWWKGLHYDHYTLIFTALVIYFICSAARRVDRTAIIGLAVSSALLVAQSTVNALVAPVSIVVLLLAAGTAAGWRPSRIAKVSALTVWPAVLTAALLVGKNFLVAGVPATSNLGGMATIMVVSRAVGMSIPRLREAVVERGVPTWYIWCFDHASVPLDAAGRPQPGWDIHARESGICYPWTHPGDEYWPHDFRPLQKELTTLGETRLAGLVARDQDDARSRQYLFAGYSPNGSARWIGTYGAVSLKVYRHFVLGHPVRYLQTVRTLNRDFRTGADYPRQMRGPDGAQYPELNRLASLIVPAGWVFRVMTLAGYWLMVGGSVLLVGWLAASATGMLAFPSSLLRYGAILPFVGLSCPALLLTGIFSSQVGGENHRYFYQVSPYLFVIALLFIEATLRLVRRRRTLNDGA